MNRLLLIIVLLFIGCSPTKQNSTAETSTSISTMVASSNASNPLMENSSAKQSPTEHNQEAGDPAHKTTISVQLATWNDVQQHVKNYKGKVVVLDIWSSWCVPCKKEFPQLVKLHEKHGKDVICLSLNIDFTGAEDETPEQHIEQVKKFLQKQDAHFVHFIASEPDESLLANIKLGAVPAVLVYQQDGSLAKRFDTETVQGDISYETHVFPYVEQLLAKKAL